MFEKAVNFKRHRGRSHGASILQPRLCGNKPQGLIRQISLEIADDLAGGGPDGEESKYHDGCAGVYQYPVYPFLLIQPGSYSLAIGLCDRLLYVDTGHGSCMGVHGFGARDDIDMHGQYHYQYSKDGHCPKDNPLPDPFLHKKRLIV